MALGLGVLASACGALDDALSDPGDDALLADASARAEEGAVEPAGYRTRPVTLLVDASGRGSSARTTTDAGGCGWFGEGSWRAGLAAGGLTASGDEDGRTWTVLEVATTPAAGAGAPGEEDTRVLDAVMTGAYQDSPGSAYEQVEREGRVQVSGSGLSASFTADEVPAGPQGEEALPFPALEVEVTCRAADGDD